MKKVIIAKPIRELLEQESSFLDRKGMQVFTAATNDEVLAVHRAERADLIVTRLDLPGMAAEELFNTVREDPGLRQVSTILVSPETLEEMAKCSRCRVNLVLLDPLQPDLLMMKAQQLLNIAARESLRVLLGVTVDGRFGAEAFYCRSRNISATGVLIETKRRLDEGERLSCQFFLPGGAKVQAAGRIIRTIEHSPGAEGHQYGLIFTDVDPEVRKLLTDHVAKTRADRGRGGGP